MVSVLAFANRPYSAREACWGCGLAPDSILYGTHPMCFWCNELLRHVDDAAGNQQAAYDRGDRIPMRNAEQTALIDNAESPS